MYSMYMYFRMLEGYSLRMCLHNKYIPCIGGRIFPFKGQAVCLKPGLIRRTTRVTSPLSPCHPALTARFPVPVGTFRNLCYHLVCIVKEPSLSSGQCGRTSSLIHQLGFLLLPQKVSLPVRTLLTLNSS